MNPLITLFVCVAALLAYLIGLLTGIRSAESTTKDPGFPLILVGAVICVPCVTVGLVAFFKILIIASHYLP